MSAVLPLLASSDAPTRKDVVIATMGASAALAGLILVFLGLLIASYQTLPRDAVAAVRSKRRKAAWPVLGLFCFCVVSEAIGFWWLASAGGSTLYAANNAIFAAELAGIVGISVCTARQMLG